MSVQLTALCNHFPTESLAASRMTTRPDTNGNNSYISIDEEALAMLPLFRPDKLDLVPIARLVHQIKETVECYIDAPIHQEQLRNPQIYDFFIRPIVDRIGQKFLNGGTLFALLAVRNCFWDNRFDDPAATRIIETRAMVCESVAIKLLPHYEDPLAFSRSLTFDFYPLADGTVSDKMLVVPIWLRISAIELAIHCEAKRFLAHPTVVSVVGDLWNGLLVFDPYLHKSHRIPFTTRQEMGAYVYGRRGIVYRYRYEDTGLLKPSRLRVPKYRYWLKLLSTAAFLLVYLRVLENQRPSLLLDVMFGIWALAHALDEFSALTNVGTHLYFLSLWNVIDLLAVILICVYYLLRLLAQPDSARDVLAAAGIVIVPRIFAIFESNEAFSRMVISLRRMCVSLAMSWLVVMMFSVGFWVAFAYVLRPNLEFLHISSSPSQTIYELVQIMFGYTSTVWMTWGKYSVSGKVSLFLYLFLTQFVVRTMVTAVLSRSFSEITDDAVHEYHYLRAVNTVLKIKSEPSTAFFFSPPLNLVEWLLHPTLYCLPVTWYLQLNRFVLKVTHFPLLVAIFVYERLKVKVKDHRRHIVNTYRAELHRQLRLSMSGDRPTVPVRSDTSLEPRLDDTFGNKTSSLALLDEVFHHPAMALKNFTPSASRNHPRDILQADSSLAIDDSDFNDMDSQSEEHSSDRDGNTSIDPRRKRRVFSSASSVLRAHNDMVSKTHEVNDVPGKDVSDRLARLENSVLRIEELLLHYRDHSTDQ